MARSRNIKPGFFTNDEMAEIAPLGRLLFIGLWTIADRDGRLEDRPKKIKAELLPYDDCDADRLLDDLYRAGFILRYSSDEKRCIAVTNWHKHQDPHVKERASELPAPNEPGTSPVQKPDEHHTKTPDSLNLIPDSLYTETPDKQGELDGLFEETWAQYPKRAGNNARKDARRCWDARVKEGALPADLLAATLRYRAFCEATGKIGQETVMQGQRFYGPNEQWCQDWAPPKPTSMPALASGVPNATPRHLKAPVSPEQMLLRDQVADRWLAEGRYKIRPLAFQAAGQLTLEELRAENERTG